MYVANYTDVCPHNQEVVCKTQKCDRCGWNPEVAKARLESILRKDAMAEQKLYKVPFTGYCEVWAKSPEEAAEKAENIEEQFFAHYDYGDPSCLEEEDENEVD